MKERKVLSREDIQEILSDYFRAHGIPWATAEEVRFDGILRCDFVAFIEIQG